MPSTHLFDSLKITRVCHISHFNFFFSVALYNYLGEITLVALGPLSNVAMAMRLDSQFASNLKELYIMGGNTEGIYLNNAVPLVL